ncbi:MAG: hypothetical protein Q9227_002941 [Pyrenula ochraceoflavens]
MAGRGKTRQRRFGTRDKNAPVLDADLESDEDLKAKVQRPTPLFPEAVIPNPDPFTDTEKGEIARYERFRALLRDGPYYTALDPSILTDENGKANPRAGVDPFESMITYSKKRYVKPTRTLPDLSKRTYSLQFFPRELWSTLDPKRKSAEWQKVKSSTHSAKKPGRRKRAAAAFEPTSSDDEGNSDLDLSSNRKRARPEVDEDDEGSDIEPERRRRRQNVKIHDPTKKKKGEKEGLEAEDEIEEEPREDGDGNKEDEEGEAEESVVDSAFSDEDDIAEGDYGDNFFDNGEGDDEGFGDDGGDEGMY